MAIDELVEKVTIYRMLPLFLHGAIVPFAIIYVLCAYYGVILYNYQEYWELFLVFLLAIVILQILVILSCFWSVHVRCFLSCTKVKTAFEGDAVKVVPTANNGDCEFVPLRRYLHEGCKNGVHWFLFQKTKYVWCPKENTFKPLDFPIDKNYGEYMRWKGYVEDSELFSAQQKYGINRLDMIVPEFLELFVERATAPFFVFQVFCVVLWCLDQFWYYSLFTLCMLVMFECTLVKQQMRNMDEIRNMGNKPYNMQVYRNKRWKSIASDLLVPGDIVSIGRTQANNPVPCDLLLLRGPCIIDESLLTGESVPQMKEPLENFDGSKFLDLETDGKLHVLFGGTKVVQHTPPSKTSGGIRAQDNGCVAYVLRTGFNTSQGKLLRTILFGVKRVTANSLETLAFILFLLIFAIAASSYVWMKGSEDPKRNRYKLFLECILILTSVIPPELPVELSLAVNSSLISLAKLFVFCTEPFRIPFAGKVQICCFDKTGTLTSNDLIVEGVAGVGTKDGNEVFLLSEIPTTTMQVLATCHSLAKLDESLVGDPLEKVTLMALDWNLTNGDGVVPRRGKIPGMKIFHRFHFSSSLKRMSVLTGVTNISGETDYIATVKGAPETLKPMFVDLRKDYDEIYLSIARRGARVLALGHKVLGPLSQQQVKEIDRNTLESKLHFVGFIIISCPLKQDSKMVVREVLNSSHLVMMITGDNPLTACHVAKELLFTQKKDGIVILVQNEENWQWQSVDQTINLPLTKDVKKLIQDHDLCLTGDGLTYMNENHDELLRSILPYVSVFARVSPKQKEFIIVTLKSLNYSTLMCGDGTNDVGALKHADVGVALIPSMIDRPQEKVRKVESRTSFKERPKGVQPSKRSSVDKNNPTLKRLMAELDENSLNVVKLGDASIAAPFTSKLSSIQCVCHVIKQGRCTLVTTLQMFKILALNALITAYSQSVLFLDGVKFSDTQATLQGLLMAACFLFISRSQPLKTLSKERPLRNIFNVYTISTVLSQFVVHFISLVFLVQKASAYNTLVEKLDDDTERLEEKEFKPNVMNSTVYIISIALQIATFAINYRGHPYMESLKENTALLISLLMSTGFVVVLTLGVTPSLLETLEIVEFDSDHRRVVLVVLFADFLVSYMLDRFFRFLLGEGKLKVN